MAKYVPDDTVSWQRGGQTASGTVMAVYTNPKDVPVEPAGERHIASDQPAYLVEQDDGHQAVKAEYELR